MSDVLLRSVACTSWRGHTWGVLQRLTPTTGYFPCNRRNCTARQYVEIGESAFTVKGYSVGHD